MLETPAKVGRITPPLLTLGSVFSCQAREGRTVAHQFDQPWVIDASAFEAAFGPSPVTDHRKAIGTTLDWLRSRPVPGDATSPSSAG